MKITRRNAAFCYVCRKENDRLDNLIIKWIPVKLTYFLIVFGAIALTACSTTNRASHSSAKPDPQTVLVTYRVESGDEAGFEAVLSRAWQIYQTEHLVYAEPHIVLRDTESADKARYVEVFTWLNHAAVLERPPNSVKTIWEQEHLLCEARNGHDDIEDAEVEIVSLRSHTDVSTIKDSDLASLLASCHAQYPELRQRLNLGAYREHIMEQGDGIDDLYRYDLGRRWLFVEVHIANGHINRMFFVPKNGRQTQ